MAKIDKLLVKFFNDPTKIHYQKLEKILFYFEFQKIMAKGSHVKFKHEFLRYDLIIPLHDRDCKDFYKKVALEKIKEILKYFV